MFNANSKSSRLIGCYHSHPHIIPLPSTMSLQLTEDDEFIVMANSALWAFVSHEEAAAHVQHVGDAKMAAGKLRDLALAYGSKEEISIIVIHLFNSSHSVSCHISPLSDGEDKESPSLHKGSHKKLTSASKLSRPKTFHGESDLHYSTASLGRTKLTTTTTTDTMDPSIKHGNSKSVKELYTKPEARVKPQPKVTTSPDNVHVSKFKDANPQAEVKKKPPEQNKTAIKNKTIDHHRQTSTIENNPPVKQTPFVQPQIKASRDTNQITPISHDPQLLSHDHHPASHDFQSLSHSSSHSTINDVSTEAQSLNESANPTWFESLPPIQLGDSFGNEITDTFGLELGMISGMMPSTDDSNVMLGKRNVDEGWGVRSRSYTQPASSMRNTDQEKAKANFNFDELLAGLDNAWMTVIPSLPENNSPTSNPAVATKSTMSREDSMFLDNSSLMEQFNPNPVDENELDNIISQLTDFINDTS